MRSQFTSYEQLPITLTADRVAAALGISRANAYILLRSDGFPTLHIGKRMVVPKDRSDILDSRGFFFYTILETT